MGGRYDRNRKILLDKSRLRTDTLEVNGVRTMFSGGRVSAYDHGQAVFLKLENSFISKIMKGYLCLVSTYSEEIFVIMAANNVAFYLS